jgi:ATP-dependent DNA helicase DinG
LRLPHLELPALAITGGGAWVAAPGGEARQIQERDARTLITGGDVLLCHTLFVVSRLGGRPARGLYDVLELFAFVRPAETCLPSPLGIARALRCQEPQTPEESARSLHAAARVLLDGLLTLSTEQKDRARKAAAQMAKAGWRWGPSVLSVLGEPEQALGPLSGFDSWRGLAEWEDDAPVGRPSQHAIEEDSAQARLHATVLRFGGARKQQREFTSAAMPAFAPRLRAGAPRIALVEAGTGTGKTLGYLAPASLWAERNGPGLWISTYTRNLQRQILQETQKLYPDPRERDDRVVLRKGRENYLCLLNFEDAVKHTALAPGQRSVALALIARWIAATKDGDLSGAEFPAFLAASIPMRELTDRRGECIYAACPHYRTCFIEKGLRRARHAPMVIANHALVMAHAAQNDFGDSDADDLPPDSRLRYVFDEGHHVFDAADSAFSAHLSGAEMAELRRWLRGAEGRRTRARGLHERVRELLADDAEGVSALEEALAASGALAAEGWLARIKSGPPRGPGETFLAAAYSHVRARSSESDAAYGIEAEATDLPAEVISAAHALDHGLARLIGPLVRVALALRARLSKEAAELDETLSVRLEAAARGVERRARLLIPSWRAMLASLEDAKDASSEFADWFEIARDDGRDIDVGLKRHWIDPTIPFAEAVLKPAHGVLITSATLRDSGNGEEGLDWRAAEVRVGAHHLPEPPSRALFGSPFDWPRQARVLVVRDIARGDIERLAAAYRELFLCAGGGGLGLFTSVRMLKAVHARIQGALAQAHLTLYAQHVDALDTATLVDLFRAEENACLLGTDALRDGVDVPGRSLRLCVFDKVPWPKPTILHKARRERFGKGYDDLIARLRLKQAFGRLIRSDNDKGVFVILDGACPSRLLAALPPEAPVLRLGLAEAVAETRRFL